MLQLPLDGALIALAIGLAAAALWCIPLWRAAEQLQPMHPQHPTEATMTTTIDHKAPVLKLAQIGTSAARKAELLEALDRARAEIESGAVDAPLAIGADRAPLASGEHAFRTIFWHGGLTKLEIVGMATCAQSAALGL